LSRFVGAIGYGGRFDMVGASAMMVINNMRQPYFDMWLFVELVLVLAIGMSVICYLLWWRHKR